MHATGQSMRCVGERKCVDMAGREGQHLKRVPNLDVNGISKDLFVQFVGDGCLVIKQEISLTWSGQLYIINSIKNNTRHS